MTPKKKKMAKSGRASAKKAARGQASVKGKTAKKAAAKKRARATARNTRKVSRRANAGSRQRTLSPSGGQAGDLQGLRNTAAADSESVDELLEEGNTFEADVIAGVERADDDEEQEVHTHEVPEDDVPEEYLDKD
jgi:hypothetical protein